MVPVIPKSAPQAWLDEIASANPADSNQDGRGYSYLRTNGVSPGDARSVDDGLPSVSFSGKSYWTDKSVGLGRQFNHFLCEQYDQMDAYTGLFVSVAQIIDVEHFWPKSKYPGLAYEWSNYRLSYKRINSAKSTHVDLQDPFTCQPRQFLLNFLTFKVSPNEDFPADVVSRTERTIDRLKLNREALIQQRAFAFFEDFQRVLISQPELMRQKSIFVYEEAKAQGYI